MARNLALIVVLAFVFAVAYAGEPPSSMALASISGEPGQQVQLPLIFHNGQPQIDSLSFDIVLPSEMAFVMGGLSREVQAHYKQMRIEPNDLGAHIEIKSWTKHPYYAGALFGDGEIARFVIAIPRDGGMSGYTMVEGPRDVHITNVKATTGGKVSKTFTASSGVITVVKTRE